MRATVLGAGVVGLTTAVRLLEAGWEVRVVSAVRPEETTSAVAAAVWFPTHVGPADRVQAWSRRTYAVLAEQAERADRADRPGRVVPAAGEGLPGVTMRDTLVLGHTPLGRPDWTAAVEDVRPADPEELPAGYTHGLRFRAPLAEMPAYLTGLLTRVEDLGGRLSLRHVTSLEELVEPGLDAVVNCTGLGARELVGDTSVYPVRGQVVRVANPGLTVSVRDEHHPEGRAYVHPRTDDCILGGTLDEGEWSTEVDPAVAESILRRCTDLVPELAGVEVLEHVVGLRPARPTVRLEPGERLGGRLGPRVVHNYGHGGAGITLSWGCAEEVVALLAR